MDKLELVPLLVNIYKGFVVLPKSPQLSQEIKEEKQNKINRRKDTNKEKKKEECSFNNGAAYNKKHATGKLFREDVKFEKRKQNK
jgi:hypothetical protein